MGRWTRDGGGVGGGEKIKGGAVGQMREGQEGMAKDTNCRGWGRVRGGWMMVEIVRKKREVRLGQEED